MRNLYSALTALLVSVFIIDAAMAQTSTWTAGGSGNWSNAANWTAAGGGTAPPSAGDQAIFPAGGGAYVVTVDAAPCVAQRLDVHGNCTINIPANARLELGSADGQVSDIDNAINLQAASSVLRLMYDHVFRPKTANVNRVVISCANAPTIDDAAANPSALVLRTNGTGVPSISGGFVLDFNTLRLETGCLFVLGSSHSLGAGFATFDIAGGILRFSSAYTGLSCAFALSAGTLDIDENVCTTGNLNFTGGQIDVAAGKSFKASGACP